MTVNINRFLPMTAARAMGVQELLDASLGVEGAEVTHMQGHEAWDLAVQLQKAEDQRGWADTQFEWMDTRPVGLGE